jgi:microsomal dipeptidase-like Zn-dependent dipeptidase
MVADTGDVHGVEHFGIGSDLCQNQPDRVVSWMREGRWTRDADHGEGSADARGFPTQPDWVSSNLGFGNIEEGLRSVGFDDWEVSALMGDNWFRFFAESFEPSTDG